MLDAGMSAMCVRPLASCGNQVCSLVYIIRTIDEVVIDIPLCEHPVRKTFSVFKFLF